MRMSTWIRQHLAALRALLVLTVITGIAYPLVVFAIAQLPGLHDRAEGSLLRQDGKVVGSSLIGQAYTDGKGAALNQYFQTRPSNAAPSDGSIPDGYDATNSSFGNQGPESIVDTIDPDDPKKDKQALLSTVCARSLAVGSLEGVDGGRPFCTAGGVGAVLSVLGERDAKGTVPNPVRVVSVNEDCRVTGTPFLAFYRGVAVDCAKPGEDYSAGQIVPVAGSASVDTPVPSDAVTASASGLDPDISPAYAAIQILRIAKTRGIDQDRVRDLVAAHTHGRVLGFAGEPRVNVVELNLALDREYPYRG
ncbi:potassium-transporting ATPase subunit C [Nocardia sp. BMG111209]|uniref:potassium-transporting ATPase subunit C n=1 Tax=Nocardia sp. BMG111209 TaxID=1160137 RepID=UPI00036B3E48|nr:potassium-transporting ATPase subunit C [Nocardia sp. BMG111209]